MSYTIGVVNGGRLEMDMRHSLYWDDFERRTTETADCVRRQVAPPVRRIAVFITDKCNFRCTYCNVCFSPKTLSREQFMAVLKEYGRTAIIHITGGEPSVVSWLYPLLESLPDYYRIHLNTNAFIAPPAKHIQRLKVSLEGIDDRWDLLVGKPGAFRTVVANIKEANKHTVTSITYTVSRQTYSDVLNFADFCSWQFPDLYAVFFSVYKGEDPEFVMTDAMVDGFFDVYVPLLRDGRLNEESVALLDETIDEKRRLLQGVRFEQDMDKLCYLSMSERVIGPDGGLSCCSHLYRDDIKRASCHKHPKCKYGCNQRLVSFNDHVENLLKN